MADKKDSKVAMERQYNIPLRSEWLKVPKYKRSKKAIRATKEFLAKHMKSDNIKLDIGVNLAIWKHGIRNPPHHIKVNAKKYEDGKVVAEYADTNFKILNKLKTIYSRDEKAEKKKAPKEEPKATKKKAVKKEETKESPKTETKVEPVKEEKKETKEQPKVEETKVTEEKAEPVKEEAKEKISESIEQAQE